MTDKKITASEIDEVVNALQSQIDELLGRIKKLEDRTYEEINNEPD